jgi:hypothetical protein
MRWEIRLKTGKFVCFSATFGSVLLAVSAYAQENYEIQVYPYETVEPGHTMVELHSNFTINGSKTVQDGVLPTNQAQHYRTEIRRLP